MGKPLEEYVAKLPVRTFVLRTEKRSGLIRARLLGAEHVTGEVITFLDAHCECTEGWLEPLLARIVQNRRTVVCPIIDVISDETFEYITASDSTWGGFNWKLNFRWWVEVASLYWNSPNLYLISYFSGIVCHSVRWHDATTIALHRCVHPPWLAVCSPSIRITSMSLAPMMRAWTFGVARIWRCHSE